MSLLKRYIICVIIFLLTTSFIVPANLTGEEDFTAYWYKESELENWMVENISPCVVLLENCSNYKLITGTLLNLQGETGVLTNYHFMSSTNDVVDVYINTAENKLDIFKCRLSSSNPSLDLVFFRIESEDKTLPKPISDKFLSIDQFAKLSQIKRGSEIIFLGFPLSLGLEKKYVGGKVTLERKKFGVYEEIYTKKKPIFRTGKIASETFDGNFLIDAMVSHGNSGSPVFVRSGYMDAKSKETHRVYQFIGIIEGFKADTIDFYDETGQKLSLPHNTGLGIVISVETVENFLKGLE